MPEIDIQFRATPKEALEFMTRLARDDRISGAGRLEPDRDARGVQHPHQPVGWEKGDSLSRGPTGVARGPVGRVRRLGAPARIACEALEGVGFTHQGLLPPKHVIEEALANVRHANEFGPPKKDDFAGVDPFGFWLLFPLTRNLSRGIAGVPRFRRTLYAFFAWQRRDLLRRRGAAPRRGEASLRSRQLLGNLRALAASRSAVTRPTSSCSARFRATVGSRRARSRAPRPSGSSRSRPKDCSCPTRTTPPFGELRRRDEQLASGQWNVYAGALPRTDSLARRRGAETVRRRGAGGDRRVRRRARPAASCLPRRRQRAGRSASSPAPDDGRRCSTCSSAGGRRARSIATRRDGRRALDVLHHVFGCHGHVPVLDGIVALKRTSPSGGGLHPVEAYPLVLRVEGVEPGLYHYRARGSRAPAAGAAGDWTRRSASPTSSPAASRTSHRLRPSSCSPPASTGASGSTASTRRRTRRC